MKKIQSNNNGFSLLEVLIAMIILAIVCVPLLRAFGTSAQTNAKAKIKMKATTAAENIIEGIKTLDTPGLEALIDNYSDTSNPNDATVVDETNALGKVIGKKITLEINDNAEMNADLPDGYKAVVTMEASGTAGDEAYPNANGLNLSDFEPISYEGNAVYTMEATADQKAYDEFLARNAKYRVKNGAADELTDDICKSSIKRQITITIDKTGSYTDEDGVEQPYVSVKLDFKYTLPLLNFVEEQEYSTPTAYLFDNTGKSKPDKLNCIYLFYYPRYEAATTHSASQKYENIIVYNSDNIKTNLYITAMRNGPGDDVEGNRLKYYTNDSCMIAVKETNSEDKGFITLRTNLLDTNATTNLRTPYSRGDSNSYGLAFTCNYQGTAGAVVNEAELIKMLTISDIDGKTLSTDDTPIRIYRVRVEIKDEDDNVIAEMDGTKLKVD